jgi:hypothetical protein
VTPRVSKEVNALTIGVISDTHGLLRPEAIAGADLAWTTFCTPETWATR